MSDPHSPLVRIAEQGDAAAIDAFCQTLGIHSWSPLLPEAEERCLTVAYLPPTGQVVGIAKIHRHRLPEGDAPAGYYLGGIYVAEQYRHRGIESRLTEFRLRKIAEHARQAYYFTNERNIASQRLHASLGFERIAVLSQIFALRPDDPDTRLWLYRLQLPRPEAWSPTSSTTPGPAADIG